MEHGPAQVDNFIQTDIENFQACYCLKKNESINLKVYIKLYDNDSKRNNEKKTNRIDYILVFKKYLSMSFCLK